MLLVVGDDEDEVGLLRSIGGAGGGGEEQKCLGEHCLSGFGVQGSGGRQGGILVAPDSESNLPGVRPTGSRPSVSACSCEPKALNRVR